MYQIVVLTILLLLYIGYRYKRDSYVYILMVLLGAFNYDNADYTSNQLTYEGLYHSYEPLYKVLINVFNQAGFEFQVFYAFMICCTIITLFVFACRYTHHTTVFGILYLIYPFPLMLAGIRTSLAELIVINGIHFLSSRRWRNKLIYICFVIVGASIHYTAAIYIIFLLAPSRITKKSLLYATCLLTGIGCLFTYTDTFYSLIPGFIIDAGKVSQWFSDRSVNGFILATSMHIVLYFITYMFIVKMKNSQKYVMEERKSAILAKNSSDIELIGRINDISLLYIVLYVFNFIFFGRLYVIIVLLARTIEIETLKSREVRWQMDYNEKTLYSLMLVFATFLFSIGLYGMRYFDLVKAIGNNLLLSR